MTSTTTEIVKETPKARQERLRRAIDAECERIRQEETPDCRSTHRGLVYQSPDGNAAATRYSTDRVDGTTSVFYIEARIHRDPWRDPTPNDPVKLDVHRSYHSNEAYWEKQVADHPETRVVVDGVHYRLGRNGDRPGPYNGFGGSRYEIEFIDGRRVVTHDLWYQGPIPPVFRDRLPDNARFITPS